MHKKCCQGSSFEKASTCTDFERLDEEEIGTRCETISVNGKRRHSLYHGKSATPETLLFAGPIVAVSGFLVSRLVPRHPTSTIFPREISRLIERRPRAESTSLFLFLPLLLHLFLLHSPFFQISKTRDTLIHPLPSPSYVLLLGLFIKLR